MPEKIERILIVRLSAIGDVVLTTPVAQAIKTALPGVRLSWVAEPKAADVLRGNPYVDDLIVWNRGRGAFGFIRSLISLGRRLRRERFDVCFDLQGLLKSALVARASGAKRIIGFADAAEHSHLLYHAKFKIDTEVKLQARYHEILRAIGIEPKPSPLLFPVSEPDRASARGILQSAGIADDDYIVFLAATTSPPKHWPQEYWRTLGEQALSRNGLKIVLLGAQGDFGYLGDISGHFATNLAGKTNLKHAAAIIAGARAVVGVDTGLLFASIALGRPTVGIFGPTNLNAEVAPDLFALIKREKPCTPCKRRPTCAAYDCMREVSPEEVFHELERMIAG